jgi:hypothetical protein
MDLRFELQPVEASKVSMNTDSGGESVGRTRLRFPVVVEAKFAFLVGLGFSMVESQATLVRYQKDDLVVDVYHGRQSYELGVNVGCGDELFSMSELIRMSDATAAEKYRNVAATSVATVESAVEQLAALLRRYGNHAVRDDHEFFAGLRRQRQSVAKTLELDSLAHQIRPKAEAAFGQGRYREAAELYERIVECLSVAEKAKLALSRKRGSE